MALVTNIRYGIYHLGPIQSPFLCISYLSSYESFHSVFPQRDGSIGQLQGNCLKKIATIGQTTVPILVSPKCLNICIYLEKTDFCKLSGWQQRNVQIIRLKGWTLSAVVRDLAERIEDTETPSERANKGFPDKLLRPQNCKDAKIQRRKIKLARFEIERWIEECKITFLITKLSGKPPSGPHYQTTTRWKVHFSPAGLMTGTWKLTSMSKRQFTCWGHIFLKILDCCHC